MKGGGGFQQCGIAQTEIYYLFQGMIAVEQSVGLILKEQDVPTSVVDS
jgi:hypothetical protein